MDRGIVIHLPLLLISTTRVWWPPPWWYLSPVLPSCSPSLLVSDAADTKCCWCCLPSEQEMFSQCWFNAGPALSYKHELLVCITMGKVALLDILGQMVQKLGFIMWLWPSWRPFWRPSSWICELQLQYIYHKWTVGVHYYEKCGITWYSTSNGSKVRFQHVVVAILAAILDFSVSSRIFAYYPPDIYYRVPNDVKSTIKKTVWFQAGFGWNISFDTLTINFEAPKKHFLVIWHHILNE